MQISPVLKEAILAVTEAAFANDAAKEVTKRVNKAIKSDKKAEDAEGSGRGSPQKKGIQLTEALKTEKAEKAAAAKKAEVAEEKAIAAYAGSMEVAVVPRSSSGSVRGDVIVG
jgi:hypothetical protein